MSRKLSTIKFAEAISGINSADVYAPSSVPSTYTITLPLTDGTQDQLLQTDGTGVLSFADPIFPDNVFGIFDNSNPLSVIEFSANALSTTRVYTAPDSDGILPGTINTSNIVLGSTNYSLTSGTNNTLVGYLSGANITSGNNNTSLGSNSLQTLTTGSSNISIGHNSQRLNEGSDNISIGLNTLQSSTLSSGNITIGNNATSSGDVSGINNTSVGNYTLDSLTTGSSNCAIGYQSGTSISTGGNNISMGYQTINLGTATGSNNVALGNNSLMNITTSSDNISCGSNSLGVLATGDRNISLGINTLQSITSGSDNIVIGNTTADITVGISDNIVIGQNSFRNADPTSTNNTIIGYNNAPNAVTLFTGTGNTCISSNTLARGASNNSVIGTGPGQNATTSSDNVCIGTSSFAFSTTASRNVGVGESALESLQTGTDNVGIGMNSAAIISSGSNNICVIAKLSAGGLTTGSNNVFIGYNAVNVSNRVRIGASQTSCRIEGIFGATSTLGNGVLVNGGNTLGTTPSSMRFKNTILPIDSTVSRRLYSTEVVEFYYNNDPGKIQYGMIAEDVESIIPEIVVYSPPEDEVPGVPYAIQYHLLPSLIVKELQNHEASLQNISTSLSINDSTLTSLRAKLTQITQILDAQA